MIGICFCKILVNLFTTKCILYLDIKRFKSDRSPSTWNLQSRVPCLALMKGFLPIVITLVLIINNETIL